MTDLEFAIKMEQDGEKYYTEQAEINKDNALHSVCLMLAEDEKNHARILIDMMNKMPWQLTQTDTLSKAQNVFQGMGDIKTQFKATAKQTDFYAFAAKREQESIDLYTKYLAKAQGTKEKELFEYLIEQEKQHFAVLDELAQWLRRADEWIEDARFGIREEY